MMPGSGFLLCPVWHRDVSHHRAAGIQGRWRSPCLSSFSVTKYFTPLFAPSEILNSNCSSKALNSSVVTISPPFLDSPPPDGLYRQYTIFDLPALIQENLFCRRLSIPATFFHPKVTSHRFSFPGRMSLLGSMFTTKIFAGAEGFRFFVLIRMLRHIICFPGATVFTNGMDLQGNKTWRATVHRSGWQQEYRLPRYVYC